MTRILFASLPLRGHLDWGGMLATAAALARSGRHAVAWASGPALRSAVEQAGVDFVPLDATGWGELPPPPPGLTPEDLAQVRRRRALDAWLHPAAIHAAMAQIAALLARWRPGLVVVEPYAAAAALAAEAAGLPLAVCGRPALPDREAAQPGPAGQRIAELCQAAGVSGRYWDPAAGQIRSPLLHVDYFSRRWYADLPAIAPQTCFVGGRAASPAAPAAPPTVLVTLGSLFNRDVVFFRTAAEAVMLEGAKPLVVTGTLDAGDHAALLAALPHGVEVRAWIDFATALPRLAGIVHHGGVGTTHAALVHGLPQVAVPHAGDQQPQAGRITQAGVGFGVRPADFTLPNARWLVRQLLADEALRARAAAWRAELGAQGGVDAAAQAIDSVL